MLHYCLTQERILLNMTVIKYLLKRMVFAKISLTGYYLTPKTLVYRWL